MEIKGHNIVPTPINDLLESYLMKIIETYIPDDDCSNLTFIDFTSVFFAKKLLKKTNIDKFSYLDYYKTDPEIEDKKGYYYQHINLSITRDGFTDFANHIRKFGNISMIVNNDCCVKIQVKLTKNDSFVLFLLKKLIGEDVDINNIFYTFTFNIIQDEIKTGYNYHSTLLNSMVTEYIPQLGFCTSIEINDPPFLTLNNVIVEADNDPTILEFDSKISSDIDKSVELLCSDKNMKMFKYTNNSCFYNKLDDGKESDKCSICLDNIEHKQEIYITSCNHMFHFECVRTFMKHYYENLFADITLFNTKGLITEHDLSGNIIKGGSYQYSCPNCKQECFLLNCEKIGNLIIKILNPENCIYKLDK